MNRVVWLMRRVVRRCGYALLKRVLDVVCSFLLLLFLLLPMGIIGATVALTSRGGALFRQIRLGRNGKPFVCYKFRTMYVTAPHDCPAALLGDRARHVTPIGRFLRRSSLDELPQLWNVLRGDMSLVGPRPLIACEQSAHDLRKRTGVYRIRPGMTGLAQVQSRENPDVAQKVRMDVRYLRGMSLRRDLAIIGQTFWQVFR